MTFPISRHLRRLAVWFPAAVLAAGCAAPEPPPPSIAHLLEQAAERQLADGLRQYQDGGFAAAEKSLRGALAAGLRNRSDEAAAHKFLAFVACAFQRPADCDRDFREAFVADPGFRLSAAELGHPVWGPVYKRIAAERGIVPAAPGR
jgi:Tfp pilus assembly protein PilF